MIMAVAESKAQKNELTLRVRESAEKFLAGVKKKFGVKLDYSEYSLNLIDILIGIFFTERRARDLAVTLLGGYLGEVLIHNLGGKWDPEKLAVKNIGKMQGTAYPFKEAKARFEKGLGESLTGWYARLKMEFCRDGDLRWNGKSSAAALKKLVRNGWDRELMKRVTHRDERDYVREEAAVLLGKLQSKRSAKEILKWIKTPELAYYGAIALQGIAEPKALPALRNLCMNRDEIGVRIQAIAAVGEHRDRDSIDLLAQLLEEQDEIVCHYAASALAKIGGELAVKRLLDILGGRRPGNKVCAIGALELIGDRAGVPYLIEALFDKHSSIREAATRAFQYIPDARAVKPLLFMLDEPASRLRILSAYALTFIGDPVALDPIRALLKDPVKEVRDHAAALIPLLEKGAKPAGFCW